MSVILQYWSEKRKKSTCNEYMSFKCVLNAHLHAVFVVKDEVNWLEKKSF
jgi:hypothetical protein